MINRIRMRSVRDWVGFYTMIPLMVDCGIVSDGRQVLIVGVAGWKHRVRSGWHSVLRG